MGHVLTKSGSFVFSQCPRGLSSRAFVNTIAPSAASVPLNRIPLTPATSRISASRRASIVLVDPPPAGPGWLHALALLVGQEAVMLRGGSRSICRRGADRWRGGLRNDGRSDFGALMTKHVGGASPFVAFDLLRPNRANLRTNPHRANEADWRISSPTGRGARHVGVFNGSSIVRQVQQNVAVRPQFVCVRAIRRAARLPVRPATHSAPLSPRSVKA